MLSTLVSLKSLIRSKSYHIDYPLFRLHYQVTVAALLAFCLILTAKILFGDTIDCKSRSLGRDDFYDNVCFSRGTYTQYAIDMASIRETAANSTKVGEAGGGGRQLLQIADTIQNITISPEAMNRAPSPEQLVVAPDDVVKENLLQKATRLLLVGFFGEESDPRNMLPVTQVMANATHGNVTNHTYVRNSFLNQALAGTGVGDYLKDQWRVLHRIIKNNNLPFKTDIRYIYSGILVPQRGAEIYSITFWHRYYQYMSIILFLQATFFYLPHYLWKTWENGVVSSICKQLHDNRWSPSEFIESNYHMIEYLQNCFTLNKSLVYKYYFCHLLLLTNLILQIIVLNAVFNNQFVIYGIDVFYHTFIDNDVYGLRGLDSDFSDLNNPMDFVFPKVTSCTHQTLSEAGNAPDNDQFLCILPLNILHDKFFLVLWFWFLILVLLTMLQLIFDTLYILVPKLRKHLFKKRFGPYLSEDNRHSSSLPELFLLDLIGTNSDKFAFTALLRKLNKDDCRNSNPSENQSLV